MAGDGGNGAKTPSRLKTKLMNGEPLTKDELAIVNKRRKTKRTRRKTTKPVAKKPAQKPKTTPKKTSSKPKKTYKKGKSK